MPKIIIVGAGFAGLSAACFLAKSGHDVTVLEKNSSYGGRARSFSEQGFFFDMGPSWYWLPDVFEKFFAKFGKKPSDYYELVRLDPSYRVFFESQTIDMPASIQELFELFDKYDPGSSLRLKHFLVEAEYKYNVAVNNLVYKPGLSLLELCDLDVIQGYFKVDLFNSIRKHISKITTNKMLQQILEFPVLFLGATPDDTPALYSFMNHADLSLGTWYPMGGMFEVAKAMYELATSLGVKFHFNAAVKSCDYNGDTISRVNTNAGSFDVEKLIATCDYHHFDQDVLKEKSNYSKKYWDTRTMSPSSLLFYIGVNKKLNQGLLHHNLFFDKSFDSHANEIYKDPKWPTDPLFYICCPSLTDPSVAPDSSENIFILVPLAPGLEDTEEIREIYFNKIMERLERLTGEQVKNHIVYKRSYAHNDFISH